MRSELTKKEDPRGRRYRDERELQLDYLLKKIHRQGMKHLTQEEVDWLERVSAEVRFELGWDDKPPGWDDEGPTGPR